MPAKAADLVAAGAGEEVDIVNLQRFHAQWALHGVFFQLGTAGHPIVRQVRESLWRVGRRADAKSRQVDLI